MSFKRRPTSQDELPPQAPLQAHPQAPPLPRKPSGRTLRGKKIALFAGAALAAGAIVYFGLPLLVNAQRLRPQVESALAGMTGRQIEFRTLAFSMRHRALVCGDLVMAEGPGFGGVPFLQANAVYFEVPLWSLFFAPEPAVERITFEKATIILKQDAGGRWNYYSLLSALEKTPPGLAPPAIEITGGRVSVENWSENRQLLRLQDFQLSLSEIQRNAPSAFKMSATVMRSGRLQVTGRFGPLDWDGAAPVLPVNALIHMANFDLAELPLTRSASPLGGRLSLDASLESNGKVLVFNGQAKSSRLKLTARGEGAAEPLDAVFTLRHELSAHSGVLSRCDFGVKKGTVSLTGRYGSEDAIHLDMDLSIIRASVTQFSQFLPSLALPLPPGSVLEGGMLEAKLKLEGPIENPRFSGSMSIDNTRLNHYFLSQRLAPIEGLNAGDLDDSAEILSWKSRIQSEEKGIAIHDLAVAIAGLGELRGSGIAASDGELHFSMSGIRGLTGLKGAPIPFVVHGPSRSPVFEPAK